MTANAIDERMHPVRNEPAWSESYYFNFVDPDTKLAMFTRMGFRPGDGWADGLHAVYLGGDRVAFTYGRRTIDADLTRYDGDLAVGGLRIDCVEPFGSWRIGYSGPAQDIPDAAILLERLSAGALSRRVPPRFGSNVRRRRPPNAARPPATITAAIRPSAAARRPAPTNNLV